MVGSTAAGLIVRLFEATVTRPILLTAFSVNHRLLSEPFVTLRGPLLDVGIEDSLITPEVEICPIWLVPVWVNQRLLSNPVVMSPGWLFGEPVMENSLSTMPAVAIRPILLAVFSV